MERLDGHFKSKCVQSNQNHVNQGSASVQVQNSKKIFLKIHGHKNRVKKAAEVKQNFRRQGEGLGNKRGFTHMKMVEALEKPR